MSDFKKMADLEKRLWDAADELRANTGLTSQEYSRPVLGLIFLRYAEYRFEMAKAKLADKAAGRKRGADLKTQIHAEGAMFVPEGALFSNLLKLAEDSNIGKAVNEAMKALEAENESIQDVLPRTYTRFDNAILASLLKNFAGIRFDIGSDVFGRRYSGFPNAVKAFANGANVLHLSPKVVADYVAVFSDKATSVIFANLVSPIHALQNSLSKKSDNLKEQREMLLPRLVSGELELGKC